MGSVGQANFLQALGWAVLNSLWQMALLWVIYQLITGVYKNARSSAKSSIASSLLFTGFAWFLYTFISIYINESVNGDTGIASSITGAEGNPQLNDWLGKTLPIASAVYLSLLVLPLLQFVRNYRYVRVIRHRGLAKADAQLKVFVKKVAAQMNIKKPVGIWISELVSSPVTIGFFKPIILVPMAAINHLSAQQIEAVLLHELSHIKRYDYIINLLINFIQTILYFNPFVKAFVKIVEREREKSCDEMVIQFQYDPHSYASALLVLEKTHYRSKALVVAASGKKNDLLHRIELILGVKKKNVFSFNKLAGLFAGLLCIIALNALLIISKPSDGKNNLASSFDRLASPFYLFTNDENDNQDLPTLKEKTTPTIINHAPATAFVASTKTNKPVVRKPVLPMASMMPGLINASFQLALHMNSQLKASEERQVEQAVEESRKVLKEVQWKAVENDIAEVLTQHDKEAFKKTYQQQLDKFDWSTWEDKLRLAYDQVDWDKINAQLKSAVNEIKLDSLQKVYNLAASRLSQVQKELSANDLKGIPDSDITLKEVEQKKLMVEKSLSTLKAIKVKKIVHL